MVLGKAQIPFHRRSRYEDILDLVNDSEEALKPFPDRDAVFYKASNKGSRFDGRQHLDKLKEEQSRISERHIRDHMMREYAHDKGLTHRSLFLPQRFNLGEDGDPTTEYVERFGNEDDEDDEYFDTEDMTPYLRSDLDTALARASEATLQNQEAIAQAHGQQMEQAQEQEEGILRRFGRGALTVGRNVAGNLASGMDLTQATIAGVAQPALEELGGVVMRRLLPPPRPLLDPIMNMAPSEPLNLENIPLQLRPSIMLEPHQPNVGATQQPLPIASAQTPPRFQEGGSSSSSGNAPPRQEEEERPKPKAKPKRRIVKKTNLKESAREDTETDRAELNMRPMIIPSKIGIQKIRETFEEANNKGGITSTTFREYKSLYNKWISSAGKKEEKKDTLKKLQNLYRNTVYVKR